MLSTGTFVTVIDACVRFLFGWRSGNNSNATKKCVYRHLYSYASVKTMVVSSFFIISLVPIGVFDA